MLNHLMYASASSYYYFPYTQNQQNVVQFLDWPIKDKVSKYAPAQQYFTLVRAVRGPPPTVTSTPTATFTVTRTSTTTATSTVTATPTATKTSTPEPTFCSYGTSTQVLHAYDFESGADGWTSSGTNNSWAILTSNPYSGLSAYHADNPDGVSDQRLMSPSLVLPSGQDPLLLKFWHMPDLEDDWDGGILEVSTNDGATWAQVPNDDLLIGPYSTTLAITGNPLSGLLAWTDLASYVHVVADVSGYAGMSVRFRLRLGSDESFGWSGWYVDDVSVEGCPAWTPTATPTKTHTNTPVPAEMAALAIPPMAAVTPQAAGAAPVALVSAAEVAQRCPAQAGDDGVSPGMNAQEVQVP
jgi:hypothetical protein